MLLSMGIAGISFSGADVGGFFGNPDSELLTRWYQAGSFHPFFRAHAHLDSKRREPFLLPEPYVSIIRQSIRTRYSYLPYWYTLFFQNSISGIPVMRPLWVHYPEDETIYSEQNQFLIGSDIMVKPITQANQRSIEVYFPGTEAWFDVFQGTKYSAPLRVVLDVPLEKIPVFQRGGSIIPKKERPRRSSSQMVDDPYTLIVALDSASTAMGELYVDDYHSFDHKNGNFLRRKFHFENHRLTSSAIGTEKYPAVNIVERIVVFGLTATPTKVILETTRGKQELNFSVEQERLTIRKPDVPITEDWSISFTV